MDRRILDRRLGPFLAVGTIGFLVNLGVTSVARQFVEISLAAGAGFLLAVTVTFALNRAITFSRKDGGRPRRWLRDWVKYILINAVGGAGDVMILAWGSRMSASEISLGALVLIGSGVTAAINFYLTRQFVFSRA